MLDFAMYEEMKEFLLPCYYLYLYFIKSINYYELDEIWLLGIFQTQIHTFRHKVWINAQNNG